jgi:hypothetical protein
LRRIPGQQRLHILAGEWFLRPRLIHQAVGALFQDELIKGRGFGLAPLALGGALRLGFPVGGGLAGDNHRGKGKKKEWFPMFHCPDHTMGDAPFSTWNAEYRQKVIDP